MDLLHGVGAACRGVAHGTHAVGGLADATTGPGIPGRGQEGERPAAALHAVRRVLRPFQESVEVRPRPIGVGLEVQQRCGGAVLSLEVIRARVGLSLPEIDDAFVLAEVVPQVVVEVAQRPVVQGVELEQVPEGCVCPLAVLQTVEMAAARPQALLG